MSHTDLTDKQLSYAPAELPKDSVEKYKIARAYIEHENTLVASRTSWYITFQGFLFAALFVAIKLFDRSSFAPGTLENYYVTIGAILICALGLISTFLLFALQGVAFDQIKHVQKWWEATGVSDHFPVITGRLNLRAARFLLRADTLISLIVLIWVLFMAGLIAIMWFR